MSQTVVWSANLGTTTRVQHTGGSSTAGSGQSHRWYIGRYGSYDYDAFVRFALVWTGVGKIVSAVLTYYTDDGLGVMPSTTTESPKTVIRRLTDAFTEGNAPDGSFQSDDYTTAAGTTSHQKYSYPTRAELGVNNVDITDIVEDWAPATVKRRSGTGGGRASNYGLGLFGYSGTSQNIGIISDKFADTTKRPYITLTYEYGPTVPDTPGSLVPSGSVASFSQFEGAFADSQRPTDTLASSGVEVFDAGVVASAQASTNNIISAAHGLIVGDQVYITSAGTSGLSTFTRYYVRVVASSGLFRVSLTPTGDSVDVTGDSSVTYSKLLYTGTKTATGAEVTAAVFEHVPDGLNLLVGTTYRWRARVTDNEGQVSAWTALTSFSIANTVPSDPTLTPVDASSFATLDGVLFRASFTDADVGDYLGAYQFQLSAYAEGDARWDDDQYILWNTGKVFVATGGVAERTYGGDGLAAGTYYWRGRVWDQKGGSSGWNYVSIVVTDSFETDPDTSQTTIQLRPRAPWRIVIKDMGALRGPGDVVAIIENAANVGASELYNSPGELHFTLPVDHPQLAVIEPKQTHYSVQFRDGDGWREKYAGLLWDFDATDTGIIFYGIDYLALLDLIVDERYDASNPEKPAEKGGSKYVTTGKNSIKYIVGDQLSKEKAIPNSPVGFIGYSAANIAAMNETLTVYSTYAPRLTFITGLLDSHRAGRGIRTRIKVRQTTAGAYEWVVLDDPGVARDNLRLKYGELVQGYRVVAFGTDWSSRVSAVGRAKDGIKVLYSTAQANGISESTWGRFNRVTFIDGVSDENDLIRRTKQLALAGGALGKQVGLGIRTGWLQPKDGYDICDTFPIAIEHGSVSTSAFGSGYWTVVGVTWECAAQNGKQTTTLTFQPPEDGVEPSADLLTLQPISAQAEWQIGYTPPPDTATSRYWLDQTTGIPYVRVAGTLVAEGITGTA